MSVDRSYRCRATLVSGKPCTFEGGNEAAGEHWRETGHARCIVASCSEFLAADEVQTCARCVKQARTHLADVVECAALIPAALAQDAIHGLRVDLLAWECPGVMSSPVQASWPDAYRGVESTRDPFSVLAQLELIERGWREEFGHQAPAVVTLASCGGYLREWLWLAARTFPAFDDDAATLRLMASRLRHAIGVANDPVEGVRCLNCPEVYLIQCYRPPVYRVPDPRRSQDGFRGVDREGREDFWHCPRCRREYDEVQYGLAVRAHVASAKGWVPVRLAAEVLRRPRRTVWQWVQFGEVRAACRTTDHVVLVEMESVKALDALKGRRQRVSAA